MKHQLKYNNLSDTYINEMVKKIIPHFNGAVARDELKDVPVDNKNGNYIVINTGDREDNNPALSRHWLAIVNKPDSQYVEYFDSYGQPPNPVFKDWLNKTGKKIIRTTNEIQALDSQMCGAFCMDYIIRRYLGHDIYDILYDFNMNNHKENDDILKEKLKNIFPHSENKKNNLDDLKMDLSNRQIQILSQILDHGEMQAQGLYGGSIENLMHELKSKSKATINDLAKIANNINYLSLPAKAKAHVLNLISQIAKKSGLSGNGAFGTAMSVLGAVSPALPLIIEGGKKIIDWIKSKIHGRGLEGGAITANIIKDAVADMFHKLKPPVEHVKQALNELKNKSVGVGEHIQNKIHEYMKAGHKYLKGTGYDYQGLTKAYLKEIMEMHPGKTNRPETEYNKFVKKRMKVLSQSFKDKGLKVPVRDLMKDIGAEWRSGMR